MGDSSQLTGWTGLVSGIGHPLLGPDHLLFLLAISFIGLKRPIAWILPMLAIGLGGSLISQFIPLPDAVAPWAEALVSLSLVAEGLIALSVAPATWLLPLFGLHGFLLGSTIVGAEPTPLLTYFLGLLIGQGVLLALVCSLSKTVINRLGEQGRRLGAGIWIGIGIAFAWVALIDSQRPYSDKQTSIFSFLSNDKEVFLFNIFSTRSWDSFSQSLSLPLHSVFFQ